MTHKESQAGWRKVSTHTAQSLRNAAHSVASRQLAKLSLPEIDAVVDLIAQVIPAGNVPGMILSGLARLPGRRPPPQQVRQDVRALFKGMEPVLDQAVYGAFFAGPAAVIWGYQNLLKLAGKDPEMSFPEGTWQFYVDYALREDTARHANETHGFDTLLKQHEITLDRVDRLTAWAMAAITCLHQYGDLLANEWYERVAVAHLQDAIRSHGRGARLADLYRGWERARPYRREADAAGLTYPAYRRAKFDQFIEKALLELPGAARSAWKTGLEKALASELPAYQQQMSILAYLEPGPYGETRAPYPLEQAQIGIIHQGAYFLLPACQPGTTSMPDVLHVRAQVASIMEAASPAPADMTALAQVRRAELPALRKKLNPELVRGLGKLRFAPILLNSDRRDRRLPLSELRQAERGVGDHALTVFDTGETFVFDQSHIFFDGAWGAALAEIMTNEALSWANYLHLLPRAQPAEKSAFTQLSLLPLAADVRLIRRAPRALAEAGAETGAANVKACQALRKLFKLRSDLIRLTINDLLVLYRAIHATRYEPSPALLARLEGLAKSRSDLAASVWKAIREAREANPSILIPMDASRRSPRDRLYPFNVEVPLRELDLLDLHRQTVAALAAYEKAPGGDRTEAYAHFDKLQRIYLASLAGLSAWLGKAKQIAIQGESASVGAIKLLAHLPAPLQRLLDKVPERFDLLNNLIKGQEVFSNLGMVAPGSSLARFITAKDDNAQKQLAWGVMTDAQVVMRISLRDFRPYVAALQAAGHGDIASLVAQDYLDSYASGFNAYIQDLRRITFASRETQQTLANRKKRP
ncbi:MAG: hypothetical protein ACOYYJ_10205 [Chloroflexota bacterium]